eukprot:7389452-Prymnesium_polylepis.2
MCLCEASGAQAPGRSIGVAYWHQTPKRTAEIFTVRATVNNHGGAPHSADLFAASRAAAVCLQLM